MPILYIFSGLPASGKSSLAAGLSKKLGASFIRVDTIEQALKDLYGDEITLYDQGYQIAYRLAADSLKQGLSAVADSCNSVKESRAAWQKVATDLNLNFVNIEVTCSDKNEHKKRIETRISSVPNLVLPTWEQVKSREYQTWQTDIVRIDTSGKSLMQTTEELHQLLSNFSNKNRK